MMNVLITAAVAAEISPLQNTLKNVESALSGRHPGLTGTIGRHRVKALATGPGQINTTLATTASIESERPDIIMQIGCGGAFKKAALAVGDLAIATEEIDVHLGIETDGSEILAPLPFPMLETDGLTIHHRYPLNRELTRRAAEVLIPFFAPEGVVVKTGPFVTVSTITATDKTADRLYSLYTPCMENMEGTAATHVALHYQIPLIEIRSASNLVGARNRAEWQLPLAAERACNAVSRFIETLP